MNEDLSQTLLHEFCSESGEMLEQIEKELLRLESSHAPLEHLQEIFRCMHTVKGNCRMMGFTRLEHLTHETENLLDALRSGEWPATQEIATLLLAVVDAVRERLEFITLNKDEGRPDFFTLMHRLGRVKIPPTVDPMELDLSPTANRSTLAPEDFDPSWLQPLEAVAAPEEIPSPHEPAHHPDGAPESQTVRLTIARLDQLMNLSGELGAMFNQLRFAMVNRQEMVEQTLEAVESRIHQIQNEILQYRLQPIAQIWGPYQRLVRDVALATGHPVSLTTEGGDTELDRSILLAIKDALGHLLRNAVGHGIESPSERRAAGKPEKGLLTMRASQKHGVILLEIADDGKGIDTDHVLEKAIALGAVNRERAADMKPAEILRQIFVPGLSTASSVDTIAGRGTGMDVVQNAIEKVGGTIEIESAPGVGTRFLLRIPQTTAIVPVLMVQEAGETYGIPQVNVVEMYGFHGDEIAHNVETKMGHPMVRARGGLVPLLHLGRLFDPSIPTLNPDLNVILLQSESDQFGLAVERILGMANLVVKPLPRALTGLRVFSGSAILSDGGVAMLINTPELRRLTPSRAMI